MKLLMQIFVAVSWSILFVAGGKYLTEKPAFITVCKVSDPNGGSCGAKNLEVLFKEWKSGIPDNKSVRSFDPMHVKRINIQHGGNDLISVDFEVQNALIFGLSSSIFKDDGCDLSKLLFKYKIKIPAFKLTGDYKMSGKLLQLNMDGKGKTEVSMVNALTTLELRLKKRVEGNLIFGVVDKMNTELLDAEDMHLMFQNIFGGNKDLEDSIHVLMNENWRSYFGIVRPGINEAINVIMRRNVEKILEFVPISLVLDGINDVQ